MYTISRCRKLIPLFPTLPLHSGTRERRLSRGTELPKDLDVTPPTTSNLPRSFYLDPEGKSQSDMTLDDINHVIVDHDCRVWVDIDSSKPEQAEIFRHITGLHPLSVEDALSTVTVHGARYSADRQKLVSR